MPVYDKKSAHKKKPSKDTLKQPAPRRESEQFAVRHNRGIPYTFRQNAADMHFNLNNNMQAMLFYLYLHHTVGNTANNGSIYANRRERRLAEQQNEHQSYEDVNVPRYGATQSDSMQSRGPGIEPQVLTSLSMDRPLNSPDDTALAVNDFPLRKRNTGKVVTNKASLTGREGWRTEALHHLAAAESGRRREEQQAIRQEVNQPRKASDQWMPDASQRTLGSSQSPERTDASAEEGAGSDMAETQHSTLPAEEPISIHQKADVQVPRQRDFIYELMDFWLPPAQPESDTATNSFWFPGTMAMSMGRANDILRKWEKESSEKKNAPASSPVSDGAFYINEKHYENNNVTVISDKITDILKNISGGVFNLNEFINAQLKKVFTDANVPEDQIDINEELPVLVNFKSDISSHHNTGLEYTNKENPHLHEIGKFSVRDIYIGESMRQASALGYSIEQVRVGFPKSSRYPNSVRKGIMVSHIEQTIFNEIEKIRSDKTTLAQLSHVFKALHNAALISLYQDGDTPTTEKKNVSDYVDKKIKASTLSFDGIPLTSAFWIPLQETVVNGKKGIIIDISNKDWFKVEIRRETFVIESKKRGADFSLFLYRNTPNFNRYAFLNPMLDASTGNNKQETYMPFAGKVVKSRLRLDEVNDIGVSLRDLMLARIKTDANWLVNSPDEMRVDHTIKFLDSLGTTLCIVLFPPLAANPGLAGGTVARYLLNPLGGAAMTAATSTVPNVFGLAIADRDENARAFIVDIAAGLFFELGANIVPGLLRSAVKRALPFKQRLTKVSQFLKKLKSPSSSALPNPTIRLKQRRLRLNQMDGLSAKSPKLNSGSAMSVPALSNVKRVRFKPLKEQWGLGTAQSTLREVAYNYYRVPSAAHISDWLKSQFVNFNEFRDSMDREALNWLPFDIRGLRLAVDNQTFHLTDFASQDANPLLFSAAEADKAIRQALLNNEWDPEVEKFLPSKNSAASQQKLNSLSPENMQPVPAVIGIKRLPPGAQPANGNFTVSDIHFVITSKEGKEILKAKLGMLEKQNIPVWPVLPTDQAEFLPDVDRDLDTDVMKDIAVQLLKDHVNGIAPSSRAVRNSIRRHRIPNKKLFYFGTDFRGFNTRSSMGNEVEIDNFSLNDADVNARNQQKIRLTDIYDPNSVSTQINATMEWSSLLQDFSLPPGQAPQHIRHISNLNKLVDVFKNNDAGYLSQKMLIPELWSHADNLNIPMVVAVDALAVTNNLASHTILRENIAFVLVEDKYITLMDRYLNRNNKQHKIPLYPLKDKRGESSANSN